MQQFYLFIYILMKLNSRNSHIDILRGLAIFAVLILHFHISYQLDQSSLSKIFSTTFIKSIASNGNYGVTIFFVISGFLITSTSLERYNNLNKIDIIGFYIFRIARIMPCLLLVLSIILLFDFLHISIFQNNPDISFFWAIFSVLTFWHNILMEKIGYFNYSLNILWSLSVEEIFYLAFPILCFLFKKTRLIFSLWALLIVIAPIYRSHYINNEIVALYGYFSCFDAIAMGCVAAVIAKNIRFQRWIKKVLLYSSGILMVAVYLYNGIMENVVVGVSIMAAGAAAYLISTSNEEIEQENTENFFGCAIRWFGKNSYELYLFHIIVLALMKEMVTPDALNNFSKLLWMILFLAVSALVAGIISTFYSQPTNKKLRKFLFELRQKEYSFFKERSNSIVD